jgi:hypothetical protein
MQCKVIILQNSNPIRVNTCELLDMKELIHVNMNTTLYIHVSFKVYKDLAAPCADWGPARKKDRTGIYALPNEKAEQALLRNDSLPYWLNSTVKPNFSRSTSTATFGRKPSYIEMSKRNSVAKQVPSHERNDVLKEEDEGIQIVVPAGTPENKTQQHDIQEVINNLYESVQDGVHNVGFDIDDIPSVVSSKAENIMQEENEKL